MYLLARFFRQCWRRWCFRQMEDPLLSCFYKTSLKLFLSSEHMLLVFAPVFSLCIGSTNTKFLHVIFRWLDELSKSVKLWINFSENRSYFFDLRFDTTEELIIFNLSCSSSYSYVSVFFCYSEITFPGEEKVVSFCRFLSLFIYFTALPNLPSN